MNYLRSLNIHPFMHSMKRSLCPDVSASFASFLGERKRIDLDFMAIAHAAFEINMKETIIGKEESLRVAQSPIKVYLNPWTVRPV